MRAVQSNNKKKTSDTDVDIGALSGTPTTETITVGVWERVSGMLVNTKAFALQNYANASIKKGFQLINPLSVAIMQEKPLHKIARTVLADVSTSDPTGTTISVSITTGAKAIVRRKSDNTQAGERES